jgi:DMSO/TMAO reductase YedYZ molybdopterin-dependent catalytic subunit
MPKRWSRRGFLLALGMTLAACRPRDSTIIPTVYVPGSGDPLLPTATSFSTPALQTAEPLPASVPITEVERLYVTSYRTTPVDDILDPDTWMLRIDGLVARPLAISLDDIKRRPAVTEMRTLQCISNPVGGALIGNLNWTGTPLMPILDEAGVNPAAAYAWFDAADGYTTSVERRVLMQPETLLVYAANGAPLLPEHGYPLRLLIPGLYGQKMPKWFNQITFAREDRLGYWEQEHRGWSNTARVLTTSALRGPEQEAPFVHPVRIAGLAFGGGRSIEQVEVSTSGGDRDAEWAPATLIKPPSPLAWTWWVYDWNPPAPGVYRLAVRATDSTGYRQDRLPTGIFGSPFSEGTNAIHVVTLRIRE